MWWWFTYIFIWFIESPHTSLWLYSAYVSLVSDKCKRKVVFLLVQGLRSSVLAMEEQKATACYVKPNHLQPPDLFTCRWQHLRRFYIMASCSSAPRGCRNRLYCGRPKDKLWWLLSLNLHRTFKLHFLVRTIHPNMFKSFSTVRWWCIIGHSIYQGWLY